VDSKVESNLKASFLSAFEQLYCQSLRALPFILSRLERHIWQTCFNTRLHMLGHVKTCGHIKRKHHSVAPSGTPPFLPLISLHFGQVFQFYDRKMTVMLD